MATSFLDQYNAMPDIAQPVHITQAPAAAPKQSGGGGIGGFLKRAGNSLLAPAAYFAKADIINPIKETAAQVTGNKQAYANATQASNRDLGLGSKGTDIGNASKKLAGNSVQLATNLLVPEAKAGFLARVGQGAKIGAAGGAGSALANNQDVFTGAVEGAVTGGAANGILGKLIKGKPAAGAEASTSGGTVAKDLATQGQQMKARGLGLSAGNSKAGTELFPQDTANMLDTLKNENIKVRGANSVSRDVVDKMNQYGQQIADHFKTENHPLNPADTQVIADNFMKKVSSTETDPRVLKEYQILADNLQKNVKDTKSLWEYRKGLDSRIPAAKQGNATGVTLSNQMRAIKDMRSYVADELGAVPGMKNYHDLAAIKDFIGKGSKEQNQPANSLWGHVLSSTPVQRVEQAVGGGLEKGANALGATRVPATAPSGAALNGNNVKGFLGNLTGGAIGSRVPTTSALGASEAIANPPALADQQQTPTDLLQSNTPTTPDQTASDQSQQPQIDQRTLLALVAADPKNATTYLSLYNALKPSATQTKLSGTQQQQANNAQSALSNINDIRSMLSDNPGLATKSGIPGQGSIIGGLESNVLGTGKYNAALNNLTDVLGRLRSGAALSAQEEARYKSLAPKAGDSADTIQYKLDNLEQLLNRFANPGAASSPDVSQLVTAQ
ncbi:hypothetical protein UFOVP253_33 [uncultured Caudovirales phage]|uniref:Uncharacterized protein n=1 Tax=uncultured Caudovirales phage TaxID=2100421 RepID=A0A6J5LHM4_9CAUD|nr:hypothetical protein UFOVP253_33 [uncultured Caudovirales phage]